MLLAVLYVQQKCINNQWNIVLRDLWLFMHDQMYFATVCIRSLSPNRFVSDFYENVISTIWHTVLKYSNNRIFKIKEGMETKKMDAKVLTPWQFICFDQFINYPYTILL